MREGFWRRARRTDSRRESTAETRSSWSPYIAGSRNTRAEAGEGRDVAVVVAAMRAIEEAARVSRKLRRELLCSRLLLPLCM